MPLVSGAVDFIVGRDNLKDSQFVASPLNDLETVPHGSVLMAVDKFALTANNITYGVAGDSMGYWQFFPAADGWGRIPVWGFADVVASTADGIEVGERVYGYLPMSTHLLVEPVALREGTFVDGAAHRSSLPAVYNQYLRVAADPGYAPQFEDEQMLFRPLYMTSWLLDDFLDVNGFFDATSIILTSASSKTSLGLAFLLHANRGDRCKVVGLTSRANKAFVEGLGCYDAAVTYDAIDTLDGGEASVIVDMAGNGEVLSAVHHHFGDRLKHSCLVGMTHWEARQGARDLPGPTPELFFAPSHIEQRNKDWGPGGMQERFAGAWQQFLAVAGDWIDVVHGEGADTLQKTYDEFLAGTARPDKGYILSL